MPTARKLPSGSWKCLVYDYTDTNKKRHYQSFTSGDPSPAEKREAESAATQFALEKQKKPNTQNTYKDMTLSAAIDCYIESREILKRSPTTIQEYRCTQKHGFQGIMNICIKDFNKDILQAAVNTEACRSSQGRNKKRTISAKRLKNEWGLITSVLKKYGNIEYNIELPKAAERVPELIPADTVLTIIKDTDIELAVLLAAWLSFSMSEVRGLTKSKSINGDYIRIVEVIVDINGKPIRKNEAKNPTRNRTHRIPPYIKQLIDKVEGDVLVPINGRVLYGKWIRLLNANNLPHMTFHDLRHLNASVMALLRIPDKYAQERGGWRSDNIMKRVYTQTFPEERVKVDDTVDNYFSSILDNKDNTSHEDISEEEILKMLKTKNPNGWKEAILEYMQHDMQHKKNKA